MLAPSTATSSHHYAHSAGSAPDPLSQRSPIYVNVNILRAMSGHDDLFKACFGSDHASAVLLAAFPSDRTPVVAATACLVPFLLDPAALGRPPPWRMKLHCVSLVAAFLLGVSSAACTRLPPSESVLASLRLPAWSFVRSWLLCLRSGPLSAPALLPAPTPVLHMSAPVRRGAVADARLGLA